MAMMDCLGMSQAEGGPCNAAIQEVANENLRAVKEVQFSGDFEEGKMS